MAIHFYIICGSYCVAVAELSSFHRNSRAPDSKIFTIRALTENLPVFPLESMLLPLSIYLGSHTPSVGTDMLRWSVCAHNLAWLYEKSI